MLITLSIVLITSIGLTYVVRLIALKKNIIDNPNERSSHTVPTPRGGGLAIVIIWFLGLGYLFKTGALDQNLFYALLSGLVLAAVSLLDDIFNLKPLVRVLAQASSAFGALYFLGGIHLFPSINSQGLFWLMNLSAFIGVIWFINLFNFLDGIDGYISAEVIFIGIAFFFLHGAIPLLLIAAIVAGFLVWNWQPAKIFMGDVGSTLLGFTIGVFAVYYNNSGESSIISWLILTSLFWFDASLTLYRRWKNGESVFKAHKKHAYQRIVQSGFSHQKTVLWSILINICLFGLTYLSLLYKKYSLVFLLLAIILLYIIVKIIDRRYPFVSSKPDLYKKK